MEEQLQAILANMIDTAGQAVDEDGNVDATTRARLAVLADMAREHAWPPTGEDGLAEAGSEVERQAQARVDAHRAAFVRSRLGEVMAESRRLEEAGFTGKDRLGRQWQDGRLVKSKPDEPSEHKPGGFLDRHPVVKAIVGSLGAAKAKAGDVAAKVGLPVWDKLPAKAQQHLINSYTVAKAVEHKVMIGFHKGRQLAEQVARERGLPEEHVQRVGKVLSTVDLVTAWTVNMPATLVATGSVTAAKVSSWVPVASLAYVAMSGARNPFALARAARKLVTGKIPQQAHEWREGVEPGEVARLLEAYQQHGGSDWFEALLYAGLDAHKGDLAKAVESAEAAMKEQPDSPAEVQEACVRNQDGKGHHDDKTGHPCSAGAPKPSGQRPQGQGAVKATLDPDLHPHAREVVLRLAAGLKANTALAPEKRVAYFNAAQSVIKRMPPGSLGRLRDHAKGATFFASTGLLKEGLKAMFKDSPGTQAALAAVGEVGGCFVAKGGAAGTLLLDGELQTSYGREMKTTPGVYAHELAHAIDGPAHQMSKSPAWQEAWQAELASKRLSDYAATKPSEGWAEFGRLLFSGEFSTEKVKAAFPRCWAVWQSHGLLEAVEAEGGELVLLEEDNEVRLEEVFRERVDLPGDSHADILLEPGDAALGEDIKHVFGRCVDTSAHKVVPCPAKGSDGASSTQHPRRAEPTRRAQVTKSMGRLGRLRDRGRRRRVLHALRNEGELSAAIAGHNLPDSEPADVVHLEAIHPTTGQAQRITDAQTLAHHLRVRASVVKQLADKKLPAAKRAQLEGWLDHYRLNFFEVKTLLTQSGAGAVKMSTKARERKERWQAKYGAPFHTVVFDDRKGHKHSGNRLYYGPGVGSVQLGRLKPVASFQDLMRQLEG